MGQASRRGTFEERKTQSIAKREEQRRIDREAYLLRQAERDAIIDRDYKPPYGTSTGSGSVLYGRSRKSSSLLLMAAMLAATSGIGAIMADDRKYR